jgi:prefoldin subunit 5
MEENFRDEVTFQLYASKLNIELSAKTQKEIIINTGKEVIGQERVNRAIKYLEKYITNRTFIKIE